VTLCIAVAPSAQVQLAVLADWWSAHRPDSAVDIKVEFGRVVELLAEMPLLGRPYRRRGKLNIRHYPLSGTPYHVFYSPWPERGELRVVAVWSQMRGSQPPLGAP
jgi:plasmid stabilization system protein ParE